MSNVLLFWKTYVAIHQLLTDWASAFVSRRAANKVARYALARLFQLATTAWETADGPWAEAGDLATAMLVRETWLEGVVVLGAPESTLPVPPEGLADNIAKLYAIIYQLAYFGQWGLVERESISLAIRMYTPEPMDSNMLSMYLAAGDDPCPALRRAVNAIEGHTCGQTKICDAAADVYEDEWRRTQKWIERHTPAERR